MEIILIKEKETPGTWRFKENKEDHPMTIYLTKEQVKELGSPESIKVKITVVQRSTIYRVGVTGYGLTALFSVLLPRIIGVTYNDNEKGSDRTQNIL